MCQNLPVQANLFDFSPQTRKLLALSGGQPVVAAAFVPIGLLEPVLNRLHRGTEAPGQLLGPATSPKVFQDLSPILRRIRRMGSRHCGLLSTSMEVSTLPGQLQT